MKQFLDNEQVQQLIDLGVDMSNVLTAIPPLYFPTMIIGELIDRLPSNIGTYHLYISKDIIGYHGDNGYMYFHNKPELIDNLFDCYVELIKSDLTKK